MHFRPVNRSRRRAERGATAVEYGMVMAAVVGISSLAMSTLGESSTNAVEQRGDRIGNPTDTVTISDPGGDTGGTVGDDIDTGPSTIVAVGLEDVYNRRSTGFDPKWQASVDVRVSQTLDGTPATGVAVAATWRIVGQSGQSSIESVDCTTDVNGQCTMTADGLQLNGGNPDIEAWFEYASLDVDPTIYSWTSADDTAAYGTPATVLVCKPGTTNTGTDPDSCT